VLDAGAGQGAMSQRLREAGFDVSACDLDPGQFRCSGVECRRANLASSIPFDDAEFDTVVGVEVVEHLVDTLTFLRECRRVVKPGGRLFLTTPNILSLKSRMRFLMTGFMYSFGPMCGVEGTQDHGHVSARTLDQYRYLADQAGFDIVSTGIDSPRKSSRMLLFLLPAMRLFSRTMRVDFDIHNRRDLLLGRTLFLELRVR